MYKWHDTKYSVLRILFDATLVQPIDKIANDKVQPLNYYGLRLQLKCSRKF